jgi:hypothetical protein
MSFSPNLKVLSDWRSSLTVAFSALRRISFIVTSDFAFGDFNPQTNFSSMAATNYIINRARYFRIGSIMWLSFDIQATLAAVFVQAITITIPATVAGDSGVHQGLAGIGSNAGTGEETLGLALGGTNSIQIYRPATAAYTAGAWRTRINGFVEIL